MALLRKDMEYNFNTAKLVLDVYKKTRLYKNIYGDDDIEIDDISAHYDAFEEIAEACWLEAYIEIAHNLGYSESLARTLYKERIETKMRLKNS